MNSTQTLSGFLALSVSPARCETLQRHSIVEPTPIQAAAIPIAMQGRDLIGIAQTGTGKTLAFGLPMAEQLTDGKVGLVLAPTRELAQQISETLSKIGLRSVIVVGGASMHLQTKQLRSQPQVIVATPGRLLDHLSRGTVRLGRVAVAVLDEADRMLDMGFAPAIKRILDQAPSDRHTMLFSATMPKEIEDLANTYLRSPERIEISPSGSAPDLVAQEVVYVEFEQKHDMVEQLLHEFQESVLVFTRTRHGARKLAKSIRDMGHSAAEIHSDRTLNQRMEAMNGFKVGKYRVLVATDIAARGIDVKGISLVLNYDVPEHAEDYVHRIGRTGRAGAVGHAITIALRQQVREVRDIERLMGIELVVSQRSSVDAPILHRPRHNSRKDRMTNEPNRAPMAPIAEVQDQRPARPRRNEPIRTEVSRDAQPRPSRPGPSTNRNERSNDRGSDRGGFRKPMPKGGNPFHFRRSDGQTQSGYSPKPNPAFPKEERKKSFSDKVGDIAKPADSSFDSKKPRVGYKSAKPGKKSYGPHAGRAPKKKSSDSAMSSHPAPAGKTGHRGWSGRPKARRFK